MFRVQFRYCPLNTNIHFVDLMTYPLRSRHLHNTLKGVLEIIGNTHTGVGLANKWMKKIYIFVLKE